MHSQQRMQVTDNTSCFISNLDSHSYNSLSLSIYIRTYTRTVYTHFMNRKNRSYLFFYFVRSEHEYSQIILLSRSRGALTEYPDWNRHPCYNPPLIDNAAFKYNPTQIQ